MFYVVGSGPAGVSCAKALLERGEEVTMLDAGIGLDEDIARRVDEVGSSPPKEWRDPKTISGAIVAAMKEAVKPKNGKIETKLVFGSDYPYRDSEKLLHITQKGSCCKPSLGNGGFSAAWGAAVLPYPKEDMCDWPFKAEELEPYYRKVAGFMDMTGEDDGLLELFPLFTDSPQPHRKSRQAEALLKDMARNRDALKKSGIMFGASRLAVRTIERDGKPGCAYCGLCMYGCPYDLIYNSSSTLDELKADPGFRYESGIIVDRVSEDAGGVVVYGRSLRSGGDVAFTGSKVFLACGAVPSTKIILASKKAYGVPITMLDSQYFMVPYVRFGGAGNVLKEELHTLAQAFIEVYDRKISEHLVHLQVYSFNELMLQVVRSRTGPAYPLFRFPVGMFIDRMMLIQGFLHSDDSARITLTLRKGKGGQDELVLESKPSDTARKVVSKVMWKLIGEQGRIGAVPLLPMLDIETPGKSFHYGGSLPMSREPGEWQTDIYGRPEGFRNVHVVDASVLPSLPAPTVTFAVMANAYRIGAEHDKSS
ncbi:MAG: GMC oxidoreductase [Candidatus Micrarchaeota archaeon]